MGVWKSGVHIPAGRRNLPHQEWIYSCGSKLATQPLRRHVVDQVSLAHAVDARCQVFEPEVSQIIAAGDEEVIIRVMANAGELACLPDDPAVQLDDSWAELEGRR